MASLPSNRKIRFALIGGINTFVDFAIFVILSALGLQTYLANIVSTSAGMACSFILNGRYTFPTTSKNKGQTLIKFLVVTLAGLWLLQPAIIYGFVFTAQHINESFDTTALSAIGKLVSIGASLVWNYYWYSRYVFKDRKH